MSDTTTTTAGDIPIGWQITLDTVGRGIGRHLFSPMVQGALDNADTRAAIRRASLSAAAPVLIGAAALVLLWRVTR